jgi:dolichyl-phosphate-mannose--protein O-mannosyl transferase
MTSELSTPTVPPPGASPHGADAWRRILYMLGFSFIAYFVLIGIFLVAVVQAIHVLVTKRRLGELETLAQNMAHYLAEVVAFVAFVSDDKPFPAQPLASDSAHSTKA